MKCFLILIAACFVGAGVAQAQEAASSMGELLELIEQGQARDSQEARQRLQRFQQARNEQQQLLNEARAERTRQENNSQRLEQQFADNQIAIAEQRSALDQRLGALKELFGVLQMVSGDAQGRFNNSLTNLQYPDREDFLVKLGSKMASATELAQIEDIEQLWYMLQQEITLSGTNQRFNHLVTRADGTQEEMEVVRVGTLNLIADVGYLVPERPPYDQIVPNGIDIERFGQGPGRRRMKQELGLPPGSRVVGIVANLIPVKAHDVLIRSAPTILGSIPDTLFLLVGDGPLKDHQLL